MSDDELQKELEKLKDKIGITDIMEENRLKWELRKRKNPEDRETWV
jgi:hypothetical protein